MKKVFSSAVFACALLTTAAFAHHGTAGTYDASKTLHVEGVFKEIYWRNPHAAMVLIGKDASGKDVTLAFEMEGPGGLIRRGWTKDTFKPGDKVALSMHPAYNNPNVGQPIMNTITLNGAKLPGADLKEE